MKNILTIGLIGITLIVLTGCSSNEPITDREKLNEEPTIDTETCPEGQTSVWSNCTCSRICIDENEVDGRIDCNQACSSNSN